MHREFLGVSVLRWALAGSGLAAGVVAVMGALGHSAAIGQCLPNGAASFGHCGWCYLAVGLLVTAAAPWPPSPKPVRPRG